MLREVFFSDCLALCRMVYFIETQGAVPLGFHTHWRGWVYRLTPEAPHSLEETRRSPRHFSSWQTRLGCLVPYSSVWWDVRKISLDQPLLRAADFQLTIGRCAPWPASSSLREPSPRVFTLFEGVRFIAWRLRRHTLGECWQGPWHFWSRWTSSEPRLCARTHRKKPLCHTRPSNGTFVKYCFISSCSMQRLFQLTVWHSCETVNSFESQGTVAPGFNPRFHGVWGGPLLGNANGAWGIFRAAGRVLAKALCSDPPKMTLCHTCLFAWTFVKYHLISSCLCRGFSADCWHSCQKLIP